MNLKKKLKVFLIEDAQRIRSVLIEVLQQTENVEVIGFAESEADALKQLRSIEWDIVIVDIGLREGSGLAVLAALKNDNRNYGSRLVFTSDPSTALKARTIALGAEGFFDKSREMDRLVDHIQAMVH
ncbi:response regulator [Undibacterium sp. TS12]|uniref:response regulator n=1 Tax=Undibacterium sp. TS12 TaxID=2908202 RepID=UPI001F4CB3C3|nr:response regulator [Undibacterium sp. TS12]MCH8618627.1 response regulator [Undibacterium sp. TS12]